MRWGDDAQAISGFMLRRQKTSVSGCDLLVKPKSGKGSQYALLKEWVCHERPDQRQSRRQRQDDDACAASEESRCLQQSPVTLHLLCFDRFALTECGLSPGRPGIRGTIYKKEKYCHAYKGPHGCSGVKGIQQCYPISMPEMKRNPAEFVRPACRRQQCVSRCLSRYPRVPSRETLATRTPECTGPR